MIKTTNLETSRLLKENGFPQKTLIFWEYGHPNMKGQWEQKEWYLSDYYTKSDKAISSPSTDDLLEQLPQIIGEVGKRFTRQIIIQEYYIIITYEERCFGSGKTLIRETYETDKYNLVESLAQMWLWLKKEGMIK